MVRCCKVNINKDERINQGDIYKNVEVIENISYENNDEVIITKLIFPYVIILNQDCDLLWDFERHSQDKILLSLLVAPLYNLEHVYDGKHLSNLELQMTTIPRKTKGNESTRSSFIRNNKNDRYHYIEINDEQINLVPSVIDFKHFYTISRDYLYSIKDSHFVCRLNDLYKEDLSHRFTHYLSRIALPD